MQPDLLAKEFLEAIGQMSRAIHWGAISGDVPKGTFEIMAILNYHEMASGEKQMQLGKLCEKLGRSMPAVTRTINELEEKELVVRTMSREDRRRVYISLTEHGKAVITKTQKAVFENINAILARLGESDTKQLIALLHRVKDIFNEINKEKNQCENLQNT